MLKTQDLNYFFTGDTTYDQEQLLNGTMAGGHQDFRMGKKTLRAIRDYAHQHPLVYLPSHDKGAVNRIEKEMVLHQ